MSALTRPVGLVDVTQAIESWFGDQDFHRDDPGAAEVTAYLYTWLGAPESVKRRVRVIHSASRHAGGSGVNTVPFVHNANDACRPPDWVGG